jgi:hypothetical protein
MKEADIATGGTALSLRTVNLLRLMREQLRSRVMSSDIAYTTVKLGMCASVSHVQKRSPYSHFSDIESLSFRSA